MISKSHRWLAFLVTYGVLVMAADSAAGELNDSMQLYFDGNFKAAQQRFSLLIQRGHADARLYYFRGLASARLGDTKAADLDFRTGAELEVKGPAISIGQALQRVQGVDRLRLEKFRRMARLRARQRVQPIAPRPIARDENVQLTIAVTPESSSSPAFRLASEVPLRRFAQPDPFVDDATGLLAREQLPGGPEAPEGSTVAASEAPVGTGVADGTVTGDITDNGDDFDVFAEDPFAVEEPTDASTSSTQPASSASGGKSTGIFGAVFRAIRKATIPQLNPAAILPPGMGPQAGGPGQPKVRQPPVRQFPDESFPQEDPFEEMEGDSGEDTFNNDEEEDPFGL